jgi:hypothetical protein
MDVKLAIYGRFLLPDNAYFASKIDEFLTCQMLTGSVLYEVNLFYFEI